MQGRSRARAELAISGRLAPLLSALPAAALAHSGLLALVELPQGLGANPSYVVGTDNFYTVTRYNWSSFYALSVIELGQAVQANLPAPKTPD